MRIPKFPILFAVAVLPIFCGSCHKRPKPAPAQINWLSDDPLTIPFRLRKQKLEKGNLVWNSSFENGKNLIVDSTGVTFRIDGWQKIGNRVEWVNIEIDSVYGKDEAFDSLRAVKISRPSANETDDPGEGVMSDFIRVIPGNYQLSFYIRLKDILPNRSRLGTRIFDAVNIKMIYYDKNKIEIKSRKYDPIAKTFFDNSFKGFSFSNFFKISDLSWSRIIGKSNYVHYIDGDIPNDTRYVKLFFGLKGSGTMWLDQVDLRYTGNNFTMLEKMNHLMDTAFSKQEILIPTPKKVKKLASVPLQNHLSNPLTKPVIIISRNAAEETRSAARLIQSRIAELAGKSFHDSLINPAVQVKFSLSADELNNSKLIFSIGKTDLYLRFKDILPDVNLLESDQGYYIFTAADIVNVVFLFGKKPIGDYYAATTAYQLFDNRTLIFHNANVTDFPDITARNICLNMHNGIDDIINQAVMTKIDGILITKTDDTPDHRISGLILAKEKELGCRSILNFGIIKHITENKAISNGHLTGSLNLAAYECLDKAVIFPSDAFINDKSDRLQGWDFTEKFCSILDNNNHSLSLYVFPVYQNNHEIDTSHGVADFFLDQLNSCFPDNAKLLWSGGSDYSMYTDMADLHRIKDLTKISPVLWDNSTLAKNINRIGEYYPGKINIFGILNPFGNTSVKYLLNKPGNSEIFFNSNTRTELGMVSLLSMADFAWNMNGYDEDFAVWKILLSRYGLSCAKELIIFADVYANLSRNITELKNPAHYQRLVRKTEDLFIQLDNRLQIISGCLITGHPLTKELQILREELRNKYRLVQSPG